MSADDGAREASGFDRLYRAKAAAEIANAEALLPGGSSVRGAGDELADVLLVKGRPGPGDVRCGRALAGADGVAIGKALDALGQSPTRYAVCTRLAEADEATRASRFRMIVEAVDPRVIVVLDMQAAHDVALAFGIGDLVPGEVVRVLTRRVLAVEDFAGSLGSEEAKRRAWNQLKALQPEQERR